MSFDASGVERGCLQAAVKLHERNYKDALVVGSPVSVNSLKGAAVAKFVTIGYGNREGYEGTAESIRDAAHAHDAKLEKNGVLMGIAGAPVQVRNTDAAKVETTKGPFMTSSLPLAGFAIIEAANVDEAIELVSRTPCAVARGVVEVWPLEQA
jgi:hypothetical protein